jgi:glycogen debranching enzyme
VTTDRAPDPAPASRITPPSGGPPIAVDDPAATADPGRAEAEWRERSAHVETDSELVNVVLDRSLRDLGLLVNLGPDGERYLCAGVPWYATLFGRDALITAFQAIAVQPRIAIETLDVLARYQAAAVDDRRDAEPGKILHELRTGEMARTGELPFTPYYGSVDATPLWLVLLGEVHAWTGDDALVDRFWRSAVAALEWIDARAARDGGFVAYRRRSEDGFRNQGWKDSDDAIRHADGSLADPPIALAEVQGYVFDAKVRMAGLARRRGDVALADRLERDAAELRRRFAAAFLAA